MSHGRSIGYPSDHPRAEGGPSVFPRQFGKQCLICRSMAKKVARDERLREKFIPMIVNKAKERGVVTGNVTNGWTIRKTVASGIKMIYVVRMEHARVEMWIHIGSSAVEVDDSASIFDHFYAMKEQIEDAYGGKLTWDYPGRRTAFSIQQDYDDFDLRDTQKWDNWADTMVSDMKRLHDALKPYYIAN